MVKNFYCVHYFQYETSNTDKKKGMFVITVKNKKKK